MVELDELLSAVESAFVVTSGSLKGWPDPHAGRSPDEDEYSRSTNPARWLIVGARAEAWLVALDRLGLAGVERHAAVEWEEAPGTAITQVDRVRPRADGTLSLVLAKSRIGDVADAGVTVGVGDPALCLTVVPDCGCDACDMGSRYELDVLDEHIVGVVSGSFRRLRSGRRTIQVIGDDGWSASGLRRRDHVETILADPAGWNEVTGASWLEFGPT